ncbi:Uncharacterised protein [Vibrio cholerae]|nr:Uncharacterised protein [Vibrio cholerae]CSD23520.1 Uncharacterised protein [Vibrio cholerae]
MGRLNFNHQRIASHALRNLLNTSGVSCTKQQGLTLGWRSSNDRLQRFLEAHFEHAIRFIQHQGIELTEIDTVFTQMIQNPSRRSDQDMRAMLKGSDLRPHRHAATQRQHFDIVDSTP